jgi:thiamine-phosphate pyrophosphorylase
LLADRPRRLPFRLLAIGDGEQATPAAARALVRAGGRDVALLLRDRALPEDEYAVRVAALLPVCRRAGALLLVHGSAEMARLTGADGVHLPEGADVGAARAVLREGAWIGASRHDAAGVERAARAGADYVTLGPVFATPGKGEPMGLDVFAAIARSSAVPVVALGGVTARNAGACVAAGAAAVAAIRGVWAGDAGGIVRGLHAAGRAGRGGARGAVG